MRESPTLRAVPELRAAGAKVTVHDPIALDNLRDALDDDQVCFQPDLRQALGCADAVVPITSWPEYAVLTRLLADRRVPVIDGRRMLEANDVMVYDGIGYPLRHEG